MRGDQKLSYAILINAAPYAQQGSYTAYHFAKSVLAKGHKITRIFFYADGIHNGNEFINMPQDETNLVKLWQQLAQENQLELIICVTAATKRGVIDVNIAEQDDKKFHNLASGFKISGLGQLITASLEADRFITFN